MTVLTRVLIIISCILIRPTSSTGRSSQSVVKNPGDKRDRTISRKSTVASGRNQSSRALPTPSGPSRPSFPQSSVAASLTSSNVGGSARISDKFRATKLRRVGSEESSERRPQIAEPMYQMVSESRPTKSVATKAAAAVAEVDEAPRRKLRSSIQEEGDPSLIFTRLPTPSIAPDDDVISSTNGGYSLSRRRVMRMTTPFPSSPQPSLFDPLTLLSRQSTQVTDVESESSETDSTPRRGKPSVPIGNLPGYSTPPRRPKAMDESPISVTETGISPLIKQLRMEVRSESPGQIPLRQPELHDQSNDDQ